VPLPWVKVRLVSLPMPRARSWVVEFAAAMVVTVLVMIDWVRVTGEFGAKKE
jgi:hypothetical protein